MDYSYHSRGHAKKGIEDYNGAIEDYSKVIEIDPKDDDAIRDRAHVKYNLKD